MTGVVAMIASKEQELEKFQRSTSQGNSEPTGIVNSTLEEPPNLNWMKELKSKVLHNDELFTNMLEDFIDDYKYKHRQKRRLKIAFFIIIMLLLSGMFIAAVCMLVYSLKNLADNLVAFITASSTLLIELYIAFTFAKNCSRASL